MYLPGALDGDEWSVGGRVKQHVVSGERVNLTPETDAGYRSHSAKIIVFQPWLARVILELVRSSL